MPRHTNVAKSCMVANNVQPDINNMLSWTTRSVTPPAIHTLPAAFIISRTLFQPTLYVCSVSINSVSTYKYTTFQIVANIKKGQPLQTAL